MCAISAPPVALQRSRSSSIISCGSKPKAALVISRAASAPASLHLPLSTFPFDGYDDVAHRRPDLKVVNWNVAAPNNNPFEYWAFLEDENYNKLMTAVQECIDHPENCDFEIGNVFTPSMFQELLISLARSGVKDLDKLELAWSSDLMKRKAIAGFLKDSSFGAKRLISMPDRFTNSICIEGGSQIYRPSPITGSPEIVKNVDDWWALWKSFMFETRPCIKGKKVDSVFSLLQRIPRSKYPAISEEEEEISIPLQTLCLALFDGIYTHLLFKLAGESWQPLKLSLHKALFENKASSCASILQRQYSDADVIFVQEASEPFVSEVTHQCSNFFLLRSGCATSRCQASLILARRSTFDESTARDVTEMALERLQPRCAQPGDLSLFEVCAAVGSHDDSAEEPRQRYLLASFHGDSDGKATVPVVAAIESLARERFPSHLLVVGLDANTASAPARCGSNGNSSGQASAGAGTDPLTVSHFDEVTAEMGLGTCWHGGDLESLWTTFHARTFVQPQLQKGVGLSRIMDRRNMQLKDWILFRDDQVALDCVEQDNTGSGMFVQAAMPSLNFPSDHAIVAASLRRRVVEAAAGGGSGGGTDQDVA